MEPFVDTPEGRGTVVEVDLLRSRVKVRMEDSPETITYFANVDIAVLRNGKAKKNDPPIPADLAPISGSGKRVRKEKQEDEPVLLEPIRFRYSTESVVEEPEVPAEAPEEEIREGKAPRSRRRRKGKGEAPKEQPKQEAPRKEKEAPKREQPREAADSGDQAEKKPARRNNHRRYRKPKTSQQG